MNKKELQLRQEIIDVCLRMTELGINAGTAGNASARWQDGLIITPSGVPYEALELEDLVFMTLKGGPGGDHPLEPSSEWRFHRDIIASRHDVDAVVHTHSPHATAMAMCGMEIPASHYMIAGAGGNTVRCADYASYGTQELSDNALKSLAGRACCLLANHGVIATGKTTTKAMWMAHDVEMMARLHILATQAGSPNILPKAEINTLVERFKGYGRKEKKHNS